MNADEIAAGLLELSAALAPCLAIIVVGAVVGGLHLAARRIAAALRAHDRRGFALRLARPRTATALRRHRPF